MSVEELQAVFQEKQNVLRDAILASSGCADADPTEKELTVLFVVSICDVALLFASKF